MTRPTGSLLLLAALALALLSFTFAAHGATPPEPGPENGGLRLRLAVEPREKGAEGYSVRLDILNVSDKPIVLRGGWGSEETGDVKQYLEAATAFECRPAMMPARVRWARQARRTPQPEHTLTAGETVSLAWETKGRDLKRPGGNLLLVDNPDFRLPGLYAVHAKLDVITSSGTAYLQSNEQFVSVGGSRAQPKSTYGQLIRFHGEKKRGELNLGARHQVRVGDKFDLTSKSYAWRLTITEVGPNWSEGTMERLSPAEPGSDSTPSANAHAELVIGE